MRSFAFLLSLFALVVTLSVGCSGRSGGTSNNSAPSGGTPTTPTPQVSPEQADYQKALDAARAQLKAIVLTDQAKSCTADNPERLACIRPKLDQVGTVTHGIALFDYESPSAPNSPGVAVYAHDANGAWMLWFIQRGANYRVYKFPGDARVCAGGTGLNLRSGPSTNSQVVGSLSEAEVVHVEEFVLTDPASGDLSQAGSGWFRLTSPSAGWANSRYLSDMSLPDCSVHDQTEH